MESLLPPPSILRVRRHAVLLLGALSILLIWYTLQFYGSIERYWFSPQWTTDDALQQVFIFYDAIAPEIFKGDLIFEAMKGYLAPLHYWLGYGITLCTRDPIMTAHYMMVIQMTLSSLFIFLVVRAGCLYGASDGAGHPYEGAMRRFLALIPSLAALLWFIHSRAVVQRMTSGLPRGWAPVILLALLLTLLNRKYRLSVVVLFVGILLNPPAAFLGGVALGLVLFIGPWVYTSRDAPIRLRFRSLIELIIISPLLALVTLAITHRPPEIGEMIHYKEALATPEFQRDGGRFAFVPFLPATNELLDHPFRSLMGKLYKTPKEIKRLIPWIIAGIFITLFGVSIVRKREIIPLPLLCFGLAALGVYLLSRPLAFRLYVPDRHLTFPGAIFFICALTVGIWRIAYDPLMRIARVRSLYFGMAGLILLGGIVVWGSGNGLQPGRKGTLNFNYHEKQRGNVFLWIRKYTPLQSRIAGHPTFIDGTQLFGARKAYATTETWHPFYRTYNTEMKRRIEISLRAHYATSVQEFLSLIEPEQIDYFVFGKGEFTTRGLQKAKFHKPFRELVTTLTALPPSTYLFSQLPRSISQVIPFEDNRAIVVDVRGLREWYNQKLAPGPRQP